MKFKKLGITIAVLAVLAVSAKFAAPMVVEKVIKAKAKERGWDVQFELVDWSRSNVILHAVRAENAWVQTDIKEVELTIDGMQLRAVDARGGFAYVDLSKKPKSEGKGSTKITADGIDIEIVGLCGSGKARALGAGKNADGKIWAQKASAVCGGWFIEAEDVAKDGDHVRLGMALVKNAPAEKMEPSTPSRAVADKLSTLPNVVLDVGEVKIETARGYARGFMVHAERSPKDGVGIAVQADSVVAEVVQEWGEVSAQKASLSVVQDPDTGSHKFRIDANARSVGGGLEALSRDKMEAKSIHLNGVVDVEQLRAGVVQADGVTLEVGTLKTVGSLTFKDKRNFQVDIDAGVTKCQDAIDSAPTGFMDGLAGFQFSGTFHPEIHVKGQDGKFDVQLKFANKCKAEKIPEKSAVKVFSKKFKRTVPGVKGDLEVESGPGSEEWAPLVRISPYMVKAVMTCEDTGFFQHRGFIEQSIANSMKENLEKGQFVRGGSTISMQLAKNLYLTRTKTISRKAQEFFLTTYLEQSLSKQEIMELYLNVIEFGPDVYGVKQAAYYYFGKQPDDLTIAEAAFLASILPSPKKNHFSPDRTLDAGWMNYVKWIIKTMRSRDLISDQEADEGLAESVTRGESQTGGLSPIVMAPGGVDPRSWK